MKIVTQAVQDGMHNGKTVWICHYNRPDMDKKALRNLPPTKVLIRNNTELPENKKVYYSLSHFSPLNKNGEPTSKVISPVDNTGYRSRSGNPLHVFDNEEECINSWNAQLNSHCGVLDDLIANSTKHWKNEKAELLKAVI